jgi:tellurite resistance protein TerC
MEVFLFLASGPALSRTFRRQSLFALNSIAEPWLWISFSVGVVVLLLVDLLVLHRDAHEVSVREALWVSAFWIALALAFNGWLAWQYGGDAGLEFLTGYLVEKSLSIDNLFVILLIFASFRIPAKYQHEVLFYGVLGAIIMRGVLIIVGAELIHQFHWIMYVFGGILIVSAIKFLKHTDETQDVTDHWAVRLIRRVYPITGKVAGQKFFVVENGVRMATPLFLALIVIEATDLVFAVDSIPAVFAVTDDPFIAFGSNVLALLGLRALYFVIADWVAKFRYLKPGLAAVLGFVGVKMVIMEWVKIPSWVSLLVIVSILSTAALSSWYVNRRESDRGMRPQV